MAFALQGAVSNRLMSNKDDGGRAPSCRAQRSARPKLTRWRAFAVPSPFPRPKLSIRVLRPCLGASLDAANYSQVRKQAVAKGLITDAEIDAVLARLDAPDFAVFSPVMFTAWGAAPGPCCQPIRSRLAWRMNS